MSKKRIYLKAYFQKNLGDDMFVETILRRYPHIDFCGYARKEDIPKLPQCCNLCLVSKIQLLWDRFFYKLTGRKAANLYEKFSDATVHIGGSIFIEPPKFKKPRGFYYPPNMFYIGCNFGPYQTEDYYNFIRRRLAKATDVCFRDHASVEAFSDLKAIRYAPDVLFGYPNYPEKKRGNGVGISVMDLRARGSLGIVAEAYEKAIAEFIDLCNAKDIPVTLFSFCEAEGDEKAIDRILKKSSKKIVDRFEYRGDITEILKRLNDCEYIIATRFHAMVLGWTMGKKVLPVIYSHKQTNVISDLEFEGNCWQLINEEEVSGRQLFQMCMTAPVFDNAQRFSKGSAEQFAAFDQFISN